MNTEAVFALVGGLGLFIYGMRIMGEGLQKTAGNRLKRFLEVLTTNRILGVLVGVFVTAITQSSSATTVMVVGFVNAGLMTLKQAVGIIMGANIGTTVTAQLIAFKLTDYALPSIGIGVALYLFSSKRSYKYIGQVLLGFGLLFLGMDTMKHAMKPLSKMPEFKATMANFSKNPLLGVLVGFVMTSIVQSSSATIGILQALAANNLVSIYVALPILFGDNIGTCVTALLSSIGTSITARRAAIIHLIFNIIGTIIFLVLLPVIIPVVLSSSINPVRQIANAHTMFNVANTILQLPFAGLLVFLAKRIIPGEEKAVEKRIIYLDKRFLETPSIAFTQAKKELHRMGVLAEENFKTSIELFLNFDERKMKEFYEKEEVINFLEREITGFLAELSRTSITDKQSKKITGFLNTANDIERVGDHAKNIVELAQFKYDNNLPFSDTAIAELKEMFNKVEEIYSVSLNALEKEDRHIAEQVLKHEDVVDEMEKHLRSNHIDRLNSGKCFPASGVIFLDVISNLERIGDHSYNIAQTVLDEFRA